MRVLFSKEVTYDGRKRFEARLADAAWDGPKVLIEQVYGISKHGATKGQRLGPATTWGATRAGSAPGAYLAIGTKAEVKDFATRYLTVKAKSNPALPLRTGDFIVARSAVKMASEDVEGCRVRGLDPKPAMASLQRYIADARAAGATTAEITQWTREGAQDAQLRRPNPRGKQMAKRNPWTFGDVDRARARRIVKLAAKGLRASTAKSWLTLDERGTWEAMALRDLRSDKLQAKAAELGLTEKEVDEQIAAMLGYLATDAALRSAKKNPKDFEVLDHRPPAKGYDFSLVSGVAYIRRNGRVIGNVRRGLRDAAGRWLPEWSPTIPRARDGAIKLPKGLIQQALRAIEYR